MSDEDAEVLQILQHAAESSTPRKANKMMMAGAGLDYGGVMTGGKGKRRMSYGKVKRKRAMGGALMRGGIGGPYRVHGVSGQPDGHYERALYGDKGHGKVHYISRQNIQPSRRQSAHRQFVSQYMRANPLPRGATREDSKNRMRAAGAAWRQQNGLAPSTQHGYALAAARGALNPAAYPPSGFVEF
jgi:hypothetical protein